MEKPKKTLLLYIAAFLLPIAIFLSVFITMKIINPNTTVIFRDAGSQYIEFLGYFRGIFLGNNGIIYSLSRQLGNGNIAFLAYYLLSPFNLIALILPESMLTISFFIIILCKIGAAGLSAYIFLTHLNLEHKNNTLLKIAFSTSYALCGFVAIYFWSIMWLDSVILLPIVALGIDRVVSKKSPIIYIVSLSLAMVSNYYMAFMLCIFSCIWLFYRLILKNQNVRDNARVVIKFVASSLLAAGLSAVILVPTYHAMVEGTGRMQIDNFAPGFKFVLPALIKQFNIGAIRGVQYYDGLPNIFVGFGALICLVFYFFNSHIGRRERVASLILCLVFVVSFWFKPLNTLWHAGTNENWFPYRYSFIFCFVLIFLSYLGVIKFKIKRSSITYSLITLQLISIALNLLLCYRFLQSERPYNMKQIDNYITTFDPIVSKIKSEDRSLYRMEIAAELGPTTENNSPLMLGYYGTSDFTSNANATGQLLAQLGFCKTNPYYASFCSGSTLFAERFLGLKYIINSDGSIQNLSPLKLAMFSSSDISKVAYHGDTFNYQNQIARVISQTDQDIYTKVTPEIIDSADKLSVIINNPSKEHLYFASTADGTFDPTHYTLNGVEGDWRYGVIDLGSESNIELTIDKSVYHLTEEEILVYSEKASLIDELYKKHSQEEIDFVQDNDHQFSATFTGNTQGGLLVTIPHDSNWQFYLDDTPISPIVVLDGLVFIPTDSSSHTLKMIYNAKGLASGFVASCVSSVILVILIVRSYRLKQSHVNKAK